MAYNPYFPTFYQNNVPYTQQMPMQQPQTSTTNSGGINWVQGESAAKSFPVASGQSVLLMDSEDSIMYIKSTDQSGMPLPLRIFDYTERTTEKKEFAKNAQTEFVSREEFDKFKADVMQSLKVGEG